MSVQTPTWTDNVSVIAAQVLARGSQVRATLDLRGKWKAILYPVIGRTGATALTNGVRFCARRTVNNGGIIHPNDIIVPTVRPKQAAAQATVNVDSALGSTTLSVNTTTSFAAGDFICIRENHASAVTRLEFARVAAKTASALILDAPLQFAHTAAQADLVHSKADPIDPVELAGGALWEVFFDYGDDTSGDSVVVRCMAQTLDSYTTL